MGCKIDDVVEKELCTGCGICVSESLTSKMEFNKEGFLVPSLDNSFTNNAIKLCPFNPNPEPEVINEDVIAAKVFPSSKNMDLRIGRFEGTYIGYSKKYRDSSSSGGLSTYVFEYLLREKLVNHLYIVKERNGSYEYQWFSDHLEIREMSKTRYIPVTLENLFKDIDKKDGKVAVSGVACFTKAIRLKQHYEPTYKDKIPFIVGIICGGLKSKFYSDFLAQSAGITGPYRNQEYRIKDINSTASDYSFGAFDGHGHFHQIKMAQVGDMWGTGLFKANACDFCDDVTTELADISLGDAWLPQYRQDGAGNSVIITRSKVADDIINKGISLGELDAKAVSKMDIIMSQKGSFIHRQDALHFRMKFFKIKLNKRERFKMTISLSHKFVQICRRIVRKNSIEYWRQKPVLEIFIKSLKLNLLALKVATKINHKLRK